MYYLVRNTKSKIKPRRKIVLKVGKSYSLGKNPTCDIVCPSICSSPEHATINVTENGVFIKDHSDSGTYIEGRFERIAELTKLDVNTKFCIGYRVNNISLRYHNFDIFSLEKRESFQCKIEVKRLSEDEDDGICVGVFDKNDKVSPANSKNMHSPMSCDEGVFVNASDVEDEHIEQTPYKMQHYLETATKAQTVMSKIEKPLAPVDYDIISDDEDIKDRFISCEISHDQLQPKPIVLSYSSQTQTDYDYQVIVNCIQEMDGSHAESVEMNGNVKPAFQQTTYQEETSYYKDTIDLLTTLSDEKPIINTGCAIEPEQNIRIDQPINEVDNFTKKNGFKELRIVLHRCVEPNEKKQAEKTEAQQKRYFWPKKSSNFIFNKQRIEHLLQRTSSKNLPEKKVEIKTMLINPLPMSQRKAHSTVKNKTIRIDSIEAFKKTQKALFRKLPPIACKTSPSRGDFLKKVVTPSPIPRVMAEKRITKKLSFRDIE